MLLSQDSNWVLEYARFAGDMRCNLVHAREHEGQRVDPSSFAHRPWQQRLLDRVAFGLMRFAVFLSGNRY